MSENKNQHFVKAVLKGTLVEKEIIEYTNDKGVGFMLVGKVDTGEGNKVKFTIFNSAKKPNNVVNVDERYETGDLVWVEGSLQEREYKTQDGRDGVSRDVSAWSVKPLLNAKDSKAVFVIKAEVNEVDKGVDEATGNETAEVQMLYVNEYNGNVNTSIYNCVAIENAKEVMAELGKGDVVELKGYINTGLVYDEFETVCGSKNELEIRVFNMIEKGEAQPVQPTSRRRF